MRILITNVAMLGRHGTENYVWDLALQLQKRGHTPAVYSPRLGETAAELLARGIQVTDDLNSIAVPDIIHGHHHPETIAALLHFNETPGIFVCHGRVSWYDTPPIFPRILRYVAVDHYCLERFSEENIIPAEKTRVILNSVDTARFLPRGPLPATPARALVFSNYAHETNYLNAIRKACLEKNIPLDVIGSGVGNAQKDPENFLGRYDLVFAKAKCAIEALSTGNAVILCDFHGLGGMVRTDRLEEMRKFNFGMRMLDRPILPENLIQEIDRYDSADAARVSRRIRETADTSLMIDQLLEVYRETLEEHRTLSKNRTPAQEAAIYLRSLSPVLRERYELKPRIEALEAELASNTKNFEATIRTLCSTIAGYESSLKTVQNSRTMRLKKFLAGFPFVRKILKIKK